MNAQQFNHLYDNQKTEAVLKAVYLADRLTDDHYVRLYNLNRLYIEVFFDDETHLIDQLKGFHDTDLLVPYLENVEIIV
jgi:hypothetical protein